MSNPEIRQWRFDEHIDSYGRIYDFEWGRKLVELSQPAPVLSEMLFDLCLSFQGVSTTLAIPVLAVDAVEAFAKGTKLLELSSSLQLQYAKHIIARLEQSHALNSSIERTLLVKMLEWFGEVHEKIKGEEIPFPRQELWDGWVKVETDEGVDSRKNQFRIGIWASQRLAYSALFFAYEDFILQLLSAMGHGGLWTSNAHKFEDACRRVFGDALAERCWLDSRIEDAKLIRHSLAHAGGRITKHLKGRNHGVHVDGDRLQIMPHNVAALHHELKGCVLALAEWAVDKPQFGPAK
ncbi:hypothetical protein [Planctomyces sp. SH-PL14]|uniref:hypothetical protein n=1 Tax=Planctomyces sp. SH-PL14 TaxID=1632864 RepID=UPI00078CE39E|nr:hypothetical protein [Planctomyces sp. SH-PL14]AMV21505.1 hypothetical protein VT03_26620 [Planctomyces sp. SH-PL14]